MEGENEVFYQIIPMVLLFTFKCSQPGLHRQPSCLRANVRRGFDPRQSKRSFLASIRSKIKSQANSSLWPTATPVLAWLVATAAPWQLPGPLEEQEAAGVARDNKQGAERGLK